MHHTEVYSNLMAYYDHSDLTSNILALHKTP